MDNSLLKYAYLAYTVDTPHDNIIQGLISKGANPSQAQQILDIAIITYCTQSVQTSQQPEPEAAEEEFGIGAAVKLILTIISLLLSLVQCIN